MAAMRRLAIPLGAILAVVVGVIAMRGLAPASDEHGPALHAEFSPRGLLHVSGASGAEGLRVLDQHGALLAQARTHGRPTAEIPLAWQAGATYVVETDTGQETTVVAPRETPALAVRVHVPLGQEPYEWFLMRPFPESQRQRIAVTAAPGERLDFLLEVEKLGDDEEPVPLRVRVMPQRPDEAAGFTLETPWDGYEQTLAFQFDKLMLSSRIQLAGGALPESGVVIEIAGDSFRLELPMAFVPAELADDAVALAAWHMPTDARGGHRSGQPENQIAMPSALWDRLASGLGIRPGRLESEAPRGYQTVRLTNRSLHPLALLVVCEVLRADTGEQAPHFDPPSWQAGGGTNEVMAFVQVAPGGSEACVLPLHADSDTPAGLYTRHLTVTPLGSDRVLVERDAPLGIVRTKPLFSAWVALTAALTVAWLVALAVGYRRLVEGLGVRALVLLSLLGSMQFCLQFVGGWVSSVLYAVLGPFNCLVGGFLTELMTYLLITAILFLLPRVGALTLAGLVSYLMGGILFGSFGLTDLLFVGSAIAFREVFLLLFRVTHFGATPARPPALVPMMLALGLADAAATFTNLALYAVLYRLFYADWYVVLNVAVTGFLYTVIGVYLGRSLGMSLRRVRP